MEKKGFGQKRIVISHDRSHGQTQRAVELKKKIKMMMIWPYELANLHNKPVRVDDSEEWGVIHKD